MPRPRRETLATSVRLTPDARRLLRELAAANGVSQSAKLEIIIREAAKREGLR